jgi:hypothetical protein
MLDAQKFIDAIYKPDDIVGLRLIRGKKEAPIEQWHCAKDLPKHFDQWQAYNEDGYNIYIGVNPRTEFQKSGDVNIKHARYVFADFDNIEPGDGCSVWDFVSERIYQTGIEMPDIAIFSGHGIHTYWQLPEAMTDLGRWRKIMAGLIGKLNSDKSVKNPERLMRLPGFKNVKSEPVDCFIL